MFDATPCSWFNPADPFEKITLANGADWLLNFTSVLDYGVQSATEALSDHWRSSTASSAGESSSAVARTLKTPWETAR